MPPVASQANDENSRNMLVASKGVMAIF